MSAYDPYPGEYDEPDRSDDYVGERIQQEFARREATDAIGGLLAEQAAKYPEALREDLVSAAWFELNQSLQQDLPLDDAAIENLLPARAERLMKLAGVTPPSRDHADLPGSIAFELEQAQRRGQPPGVWGAAADLIRDIRGQRGR
jgi:hypothetical protein